MKYRDMKSPFFLLIKTKEDGSVRYEQRKTTLVGEFENDRDKVQEIFDYMFPPSEYLQRPISGKMPIYVATLKAYSAGALIFEQTRYFDPCAR